MRWLAVGVLLAFFALIAPRTSRGQTSNASQLHAKASGLDSIVCSFARSVLSQTLSRKGLHFDSLTIFLPESISRHWQHSDTASKGKAARTLLAIDQVHGTLRLDDTSGETSGVLAVSIRATVIRTGGTASEPLLLTDSTAIKLDGSNSEEALHAQHDLVEVVAPEPTGFLHGVLEPALVVLGAIAVIALFFTIRS